MKQTLKIGAMLLVVAALVTTGIAVAQSDDGAPVLWAADDTTDDDQAALTDDRPIRSRILEWLAPLVEEETIDQDQAEAVADALADHLPRLRQGVVRGLHALDEAADFLGMTVQELVESASDGTTLGDLAEEQGVGADALIDHLVGLVEERLDEAVAGGWMTEDEAAEHLAQATDRITDLVNGVLERPFLGDGLGRGPGMGCDDESGMGFGRRGAGMGNGPAGDGSGLTELDT